MKKILVLLFIISGFINAQQADSLFVLGNNFYKESKFNEAINQYKKIESKNLISVDLYYNLANCYYKLNKVGPAIYYYEKALKIDPLNADVTNNLIFAKRLALDNIEELPKTVFQKLNSNYIAKLSYNQWAIVTIIFSFTVGIFFLLFYFASTPAKKRLFFVFSSIALIVFVLTLFITYSQYNFSLKNKEAIIFADKTEVRNAPTLNSEEVFTLHEGTKVWVLDAVDNWSKIKLADGKIGWIIADELKILSDF